MTTTPRAIRLIRFAGVAAILAATLLVAPVARTPAGAATQPSSPYPGGHWEPGPAQYGYTTVATTVTMDDGVELSATIGYPTSLETGERAPGRFPVIVSHNPYDNNMEPLLIERGYIFASLRPRGTGLSGGEVGLAGPRDWQDGARIVDWAAHRLDGSDGRIGLFGGSYVGLHALTDAAAVGPNSPVKAVAGFCSAAAPGYFSHEVFINGGMLTHLGASAAAFGALTGGQPGSVSFFSQLEADMVAGGERAYDRAFWKARERHFASDIVRNDVPTLLWVGWDDLVENTALQMYASLQQVSAGQPVDKPMLSKAPGTGRHQMIVTEGEHCSGLDKGIMLQWFETWVRGVDTGISEHNVPLHVQDKVTGQWANVTNYPMVSEYTNYHLTGDGALASSPAASATETLQWAQPDTAGAQLTFTSAALADGATVAGPMSATLYAASSNRNLQIFATLSDVAPDGTSKDISAYGPVLGSQRKLDANLTWHDSGGKLIRPWLLQERDEYLVPGYVYRFDIAMEAALWSVEPSHSLRLTLTTQLPDTRCRTRIGTTEPCYNTAPQLETLPGGTYTLQFGGQHDSHVNLPLLPYGCLGAVRSAETPTSKGAIEPLDWDTKSGCSPTSTKPRS